MSHDILIFERDKGVRDFLASFTRQLLQGTRFSSLMAKTSSKAIECFDRCRPRIVVTEAMPTLDPMNPLHIQSNDPGIALIRHIRENSDPDAIKPWIIVLMSRLPKDIPQEIYLLLGEMTTILCKPFRSHELFLPIKALLNLK